MGQSHSGARTPTAIEQEVYDKNLGALKYTEIPSGMKQRFDYTGGAGGQPLYIGFAPSGLAEGTAGWVIYKFTFDGDNVTQRNVYGAGTNQNANWTSRADYTYS